MLFLFCSYKARIFTYHIQLLQCIESFESVLLVTQELEHKLVVGKQQFVVD